MRLQGITLIENLLRQLEERNLTFIEQVGVRCQLSKEFEEVGNYEAAKGILGDLWPRVGEFPRVDNLENRTQAEVLLRAGVLTGIIGQARQIEGAQEQALDLISRSQAVFEDLADEEKTAEALTELGVCYWRTGAFDNARATYKTAIKLLEEKQNDLLALAILRLANLENAAEHFQEALNLLKEAEPIFLTTTNNSLRGKYHMNLAMMLKDVSLTEKGSVSRDRALVEFAAASYHLKQAGHERYWARSENNLGFMLFTIGNFTEAHEHLDRAHRLFSRLKEPSNCAQVDETRARAFLAEGRYSEAVKASHSAVKVLEKSDEQAELSKALTTYGIALARNGSTDKAREAFRKAAQVAERASDNEVSGIAYLAMMEEVGETFSPDELHNIFNIAHLQLRNSQSVETLARLLNCAEQVLASEKRPNAFSQTEFIHASEITKELLKRAKRVADTPCTILLTGETGTGKEVLARLIHQWSGRKGRFVALNCAAITDSLAESELFGHVKGSFTDAVKDAPGAVLQAAGGTLFLDEVGELSAGIQAKILRLIDNSEIHTVGAGEPQAVNVRIIAATNRNLSELVKQGKFRSDLMYRLQVFQIVIPPLRERADDIPTLAEHFFREASERHSKRVLVEPEALLKLKGLYLRGNVRELRTLIERTILMVEEGNIITAEAVESFTIRRTSSDYVAKGNLANGWLGCTLKEEVFRYEGELIRKALEDSNGSVTDAAKLLGMKHQTLVFTIKNKHRELQSVRTPAKPRRKSYITLKKKKLKK